MFVRSATGVFGSVNTASVALALGTLSPVSADSSAVRSFDSMRRASAGSLSPVLICSTSPDGDVSLRHQRDLAIAHHGDGRVVIDVVQRFECLGAATLHHHGDCHGQGDGEEDAHAFENVGVAAGHGAG